MKYNISKHNAERVIHLPGAEVAAKYRDGATLAEISAEYNVSQPTIAKALDAEGVNRRHAKQRQGKMAGEANPAWNGGRRVRPDGYVIVWTPSGERLEHRVVAERALGRPLSEEEIVHHRDGNRKNNDPSNLEVMPSQSVHAQHHAPEISVLLSKRRGDSNPRAKLNSANVATIRTSTSSSRELARQFSVHPSTIQRIKNGTGWNDQ